MVKDCLLKLVSDMEYFSFFSFLILNFWLVILGENCNIVSRAQWGARSPTDHRNRLQVNPPRFVIVHHSDTPQCNSLEACKSRVKSIQDYHMDHNKWADIGYNFLIGTDGTIFEGRGWGIGGAHAPSFNSKSIGICLIGNYQSVSPPDVQISALKSLISCGVSNGKIQNNYSLAGHRQVTQTSCPGNKLYEVLTGMENFVSHPQ